MYIIDNITDDNHESVIEKLISYSDEMIIISPFCFSDFGYFFNKISSLKSVTLITTLKKAEIVTKIDALLSFKQNTMQFGMGNSILIDNVLHGKVYIFKHNGIPVSAIVTSANITHNGLRNNHEWGCCIDDKQLISDIEKKIISAVEYRLTDDMLDKISLRVAGYKKNNPILKKPDTPSISIDDIIISEKYDINIDQKTRIFIKPIGSTGAEIYNGDFSNETRQYFAVRPKAVRENDLLISYAVGAKKIISVFKVLSDTPNHTGNDNDRWPWYVDVASITPKFGEVWFEKDLYITQLAKEYSDVRDPIITNNGGQTLGALQWGVDKIHLAHAFGIYLISTVMTIEEKL